MVEMPRLDQRRVKRLAVEADEGTGTGELGANPLKQLPLVGGPQQHELPRHKTTVVVKQPAADQKRIGAGSTTQAGRFQVEEEEGWGARHSHDERRFG